MLSTGKTLAGEMRERLAKDQEETVGAVDKAGPADFPGPVEARRELAAFSGESRSVFLLVLFGALLAVAAFTMTRGAYDIGIEDIRRVLAFRLGLGEGAGPHNALHDTIVWNLRLPRVLLAMAVGMALASAGAVFQGCFRNPLVEPYILGVSSGAAFGAALGIVVPSFLFSVQTSAFLFALVAVFGSYGLGRVRGETPVVTLILAGVIVGSIFSALVSVLKYVAHDTALREIVFWLMGGFYYTTWRDVLVVSPVVLACFVWQWSLSWKLNVLSMGDEEARALGVHPEKYKMALIVLATLSTSVSVSTVGIVAWVGLMMPHATRMMIGPDHRFVLPASAMLGGIYLLVCDTLARTLTTAEIPIGILTSLLGAPYLFYLLRAKGSFITG